MYEYQQPFWVQPQQQAYNPYQMQARQNIYSNPAIQQPVAQSGLSGRQVNDISEVNANEVPMDGSRAVFIRSDGAEVYTKQWTANGNISTVTYKPVFPDVSNSTTNGEKANVGGLDAIMEVLASVNERLDRIESALPTKRTAKKEVVASE